MTKHFLITLISLSTVASFCMESKQVTINRHTQTGITKPTQQKKYTYTKSEKTVHAAKRELEKKSHNFIYDQYTQSRGEPKMLALYCDDCNTELIRYQKDGPGRLLRCYLDRIHSPENLKNRQYGRFNTRTSPNLSCPKCRLIIGTPMIYAPENRPAYKLRNNCSYFKEIRN